LSGCRGTRVWKSQSKGQMRHPGHIAAILFSILVSFLPFLCTRAGSLPLRFDVHAQDQNLAQEVRGILESAHQRMSDFLEDTATGVITVEVANSHEEFVSKVGQNFPEWGIACAIPSRDLIVLKSPFRFEYQRPFSQVVTHELAHILLGRLACGRRIPRWLDEGFAMYQSREWKIGDDLAVARAVLTGSVLRLSQIESVNAFKESKAQLAYTESFLAVSYLYREFGQGTVEELVGHLAGGSSLDAAFMKTLGSNYLAFQLEFEKYVLTKYNWTSLLGDTLVIWIGLAFLFILLYFVKRRWARKTIRQWQREEETKDTGDEFPQNQTQD
jgi:hypothetical protein